MEYIKCLGVYVDSKLSKHMSYFFMCCKQYQFWFDITARNTYIHKR